jgi:hypothetical protein
LVVLEKLNRILILLGILEKFAESTVSVSVVRALLLFCFAQRDETDLEPVYLGSEGIQKLPSILLTQVLVHLILNSFSNPLFCGHFSDLC